VRLLQRYDKMEYSNPRDIVRHNLTLTNCPADPVNVKMHVAS
jgi:hypothetical protein